MTPIQTLLAALQQAGCEPQQVTSALWLAACPSCRDQGRFSLLEVRAATGGSSIRCTPPEEPT